MRGDNSLLYIVLVIVILHFAVGIGYLIYKLAGPVKKIEQNKEQESQNNEE